MIDILSEAPLHRGVEIRSFAHANEIRISQSSAIHQPLFDRISVMTQSMNRTHIDDRLSARITRMLTAVKPVFSSYKHDPSCVGPDRQPYGRSLCQFLRSAPMRSPMSASAFIVSFSNTPGLGGAQSSGTAM